MEKQHGNTANQNASKDNVKMSHIHIRCTQDEKANIVRNLRDNEKLSQFILKACEKEIESRS